MNWGMNMVDDHDEFDRLLAETSRPVGVSDDLMARVLGDAERISRMRRPVPVWEQMREAVGGWPALGGLAVASLAGLWIGFAPPAMLPDPAGLLVGADNSAITDTWEAGFFDTAAILEES